MAPLSVPYTYLTCVTVGVTGIHLDCFEGCYTCRGRSRCSKGVRLTKLPCIWEARSDQPGVPAFENLSMAKAVQYVVSALRLAALTWSLRFFT